MAARITKRQADNVGAAIQTAKIVRRLQAHALGEIEMTPSEVQAARILLAKTLPDQAATHHSGEVSVSWQLRLT